ncbi:Metal-dependent hydrolase, endonuclease/exonuclease/phosphatase family [Planifilum fulgidum]|uniref:Metal-dependent hydrolase, endonuclease/exonuclease/phosphatase family n=1 Tax=Planifilum fulgidum TaxID=201973 RepID=A0A1I2LYT1_9BACL|nr:endonuclease/exonuclease/phosphatase family protein [Planifilum fulgidum]SFF84393.1 Metal-dependent hydrolase, endonuclease/exonuclease/phosphatase family [Planifilum fulgidum]
MLAKLLRGWLMVAVLGMLPAFGAEAGDAVPPKGRAVKVLTYNIAHGVGHDGRLDLDRIAGVIRRSGADVVALQEVDKHWDARSDFVDQAAALGEKLNMRVRFAPIYSLDPPEPGKPRREYGLAILSRYPITRFKNHELSRISSLEPEKGVQKLPGFPEAVINLHGRKIHLFNTHLSWLDPEVRLLEAEEMLEIMGSARHPVVLAGDMNALPDAPEIDRLREVLTDTFEAAGEGDGYTFPVPDPVRRIDYIFASPDIRVLDSRVIEGEGSDHYAVLSTLWVE